MAPTKCDERTTYDQTFAPRGRLAVVGAAFAAATLVGGAIAVTLTLAPGAWPVVAARVLRLCR